MVYQTTDVQYVIANNNLWASPLDQQLRTTLVANLSQQLPGWVVSSQPLGSEQDTLNVAVNGFHGRYDGRVIVSGEWLLKHQGQLIKRPFNIVLKQQQDGYDAMVKTLAQAWSQEAVAIAGELNSSAISKFHKVICRAVHLSRAAFFLPGQLVTERCAE